MVQLRVKQKEQQQAIEHGAQLLPDGKTLIIPDNITDINKFTPWLPQEEGFIVQRPYLILRGKWRRWKCKQPMQAVALGAKCYQQLDFANADTLQWTRDSRTSYTRSFMRKYIPLIFLLAACNLPSDTKKSGLQKNSESIDESKRNGVFQTSLRVNKTIVNFGANQTDTIREIWSENMWAYNTKEEIVKNSDYQMLILFAKASREYNDKILFKDRNGYFGWNGVLFKSYDNLTDTIYVISKDTNSSKIVDTLIVYKP